MVTADTVACPTPSPPDFTGMPKKSANDAPIGLVRMYAAQKVSTGFSPARHSPYTTRMAAVKTIPDTR
jgi:hypothetical protein